MNKEGSKKIIFASLFFGSLWGIAEAVLGYVLHMLPFSLMGFVMFPIGFIFMRKAYEYTKKPAAVFYTGIAAASIKLFDLFLPFLPTIKVVHPAVSILYEALAVSVAIKLFVKENRFFGIKGALSASCIWRAIFVLDSAILLNCGVPSNIIENGLLGISQFIIGEGTVNALLIYAYLKLVQKSPVREEPRKLNIKPSVSMGVFAAAIAIELLFKTI